MAGEISIPRGLTRKGRLAAASILAVLQEFAASQGRRVRTFGRRLLHSPAAWIATHIRSRWQPGRRPLLVVEITGDAIPFFNRDLVEPELEAWMDQVLEDVGAYAQQIDDVHSIIWDVDSWKRNGAACYVRLRAWAGGLRGKTRILTHLVEAGGMEEASRILGRFLEDSRTGPGFVSCDVLDSQGSMIVELRPNPTPPLEVGRPMQRLHPSRYDSRQLAMGAEVEMEHTGDRRLATAIAMHHLDEFPDYYDRLLEMEHAAEAHWKGRRK